MRKQYFHVNRMGATLNTSSIPGHGFPVVITTSPGNIVLPPTVGVQITPDGIIQTGTRVDPVTNAPIITTDNTTKYLIWGAIAAAGLYIANKRGMIKFSKSKKRR